jgi:hypothetical protein
MDQIGVFTPEQARELWQDYQSRKQLNPQVMRNYPLRREIVPGSPFRTVVLDAAIAAATNALTTPATATASVLGRNSSGNLYDTTTNITVVNRYEHITLAQYTMAIVSWVDGEWRLTSADCDALGSWP